MNINGFFLISKGLLPTKRSSAITFSMAFVTDIAASSIAIFIMSDFTPSSQYHRDSAEGVDFVPRCLSIHRDYR